MLVMQFVAASTLAAATRLDLNGGPGGTPPVKTLRDGTDLGAPPLERVTASPVDRDGDTPTHSRYGSRTLTLALRVYGTAQTFAAFISDLTRELDRESNWLKWQPGDAPAPVFFPTWRTDISRVDFTNAGVGNNKWDIEVAILAAPFALGPVVTGSAVTVNNDPAAASNPLGFSLPAIKGDVAAPLNLQFSTASMQAAGATVLLSAHTSPAATARVILQAESATRYTDTTLAGVTDSALSGSGNNYVRTSFATPEMVDRFGFPALNIRFGSYKVLARLKKSTAGDVFDVRRAFYNTSGGTPFYGRTVRYGATSSTGPHWLDLGTVALPAGPTPPGVASGVVGDVRVQASRISGSGTLDSDCVVLVPVELPDNPRPRTSLTWFARGDNALVVGYNSDDDEVWTQQGGTVYGYAEAERGGSLPMVYPGYDNHVALVRHVGIRAGASGTVPSDTKTWTSTVTWSYQPRWLYVSKP